MTDFTPQDDIIIHVDNVSKRYQQAGARTSLRHEAVNMVRRIIGRSTTDQDGPTPFWALRHINFTVRRGESVGIVGRNGAGKTTLLRLLSNVTQPTEGTVTVNGNFTSLVGLGAGFNMERTGRENIFLNAAIYGLHPNQTQMIEQDIIDFSELGEFIDRPVKRYSSGMVARLGFSVAVHILPDIIFLDEILAVGDAAFQEKCTARIFELRAQKRTLLYVSHSAAAVKELCDRAILLHHGHLIADDNVLTIFEQYERLLQEETAAAGATRPVAAEGILTPSTSTGAAAPPPADNAAVAPPAVDDADVTPPVPDNADATPIPQPDDADVVPTQQNQGDTTP